VRVLIDTQVIIWLATGAESRLSGAAKRCFQEADELFLSLVSYWEISIKRGIKKLRWDEEEAVAFERGLRENQIQQLAIRRIHCDGIVALPRYHRDPFDRMLIAQAQAEGLSIMTADPHFRKYEVKVVW
jgi:PIN domain nuclease of toxin-antitoxin system